MSGHREGSLNTKQSVLSTTHTSEIVPEKRRKPNWLLRGLVAVSCGVHLLALMHIAGIYQSRALTFIELTLKDISRPRMRTIPRPRPRPRTPIRPADSKELDVRPKVLSPPQPLKIEKVEKDFPDTLVEKVAIPGEITAGIGLEVTNWHPANGVDASAYANSKDYLEMVRLKIEGHKKYPPAAKLRRIEGRATVRFVIAQNGQATHLKIVGSSRNWVLDQAAISAVETASPFPRPPTHLFAAPIHTEITIVFELI